MGNLTRRYSLLKFLLIKFRLNQQTSYTGLKLEKSILSRISSENVFRIARHCRIKFYLGILEFIPYFQNDGSVANGRFLTTM